MTEINQNFSIKINSIEINHQSVVNQINSQSLPESSIYFMNKYFYCTWTHREITRKKIEALIGGFKPLIGVQNMYFEKEKKGGGGEKSRNVCIPENIQKGKRMMESDN